MKSYYLYLLRYVLSFIGLMIGFSSKILAQYGAPTNYFKINGNIKSEICNDNLPGIAIKIEDKSNNRVNELVSDSAGNFSFTGETEWGNKTIQITFKDVDEAENHGEFLPQTLTYQISRQNIINVNLPHSGRPPCYPDDTKTIAPIDTSTSEINKKNCPSRSDTDENSPLENSQFFDAILYPNPTQNCFYLRFKIEFKSDIKLAIYSSIGQLILTDQFIIEDNAQEKKIDINAFTSGSYILSLSDGRKTISKNFIVQK